MVAFFAPFLASALAYALAPQGTVRFHALQALVYAAGITLLWGAYPAEPAWLQRLQARFGRWPLAITAGVMGGSLAVLGGLAIRHW